MQHWHETEWLGLVFLGLALLYTIWHFWRLLLKSANIPPIWGFAIVRSPSQSETRARQTEWAKKKRNVYLNRENPKGHKLYAFSSSNSFSCEMIWWDDNIFQNMYDVVVAVSFFFVFVCDAHFFFIQSCSVRLVEHRLVLFSRQEAVAETGDSRACGRQSVKCS